MWPFAVGFSTSRILKLNILYVLFFINSSTVAFCYSNSMKGNNWGGGGSVKEKKLSIHIEILLCKLILFLLTVWISRDWFEPSFYTSIGQDILKVSGEESSHSGKWVTGIGPYRVYYLSCFQTTVIQLSFSTPSCLHAGLLHWPETRDLGPNSLKTWPELGFPYL